MSNSYYAALNKNDAELAAETRDRDSNWFATIETALDQVIQGLNEFSERKGRPKGELESARLFLATHTFRNLHMALLLTECCYYQQGAMLIRTAMEAMLIAEDTEVYPKTLKAMLYGNPADSTRLGRGDLSYGSMAKRISPETAEAWKDTYDAVSVYATHPRRVSLELMVTWDEADDSHLGINPNYSREQLAVCLELISKECMNLIKTVTQLLAGTEGNWPIQVYPTFKELEEIIDELRQMGTEIG